MMMLIIFINSIDLCKSAFETKTKNLFMVKVLIIFFQEANNASSWLICHVQSLNRRRNDHFLSSICQGFVKWMSQCWVVLSILQWRLLVNIAAAGIWHKINVGDLLYNLIFRRQLLQGQVSPVLSPIGLSMHYYFWLYIYVSVMLWWKEKQITLRLMSKCKRIFGDIL